LNSPNLRHRNTNALEKLIKEFHNKTLKLELA